MKKILILILVCMSIKVGAQTSTFSRVDSLLEQGRYRLVLKQLKSFDTLQDVANYKIGNVYASIDNHKKAIEFYKKSLEINKNFKVEFLLGKSYQAIRKDKKAIDVYQKLLDENPNNLLLGYRLGKLYLKNNQTKAAKNIFEKLIALDTENPNYDYQLGLISARKADGNGMLDNFLNAYKKDSLHVKSIYQLARTFSLIRKRDSSKLFTDKGLRLDSLHINLNKLKINALFRDKKYAKAIEKLKILDALTPNDLYNKKMLGRSYFNIDSLDLAKENFEAAKKLDKEDFKILTYLGHIYKAKKDYRNAMIHYLRATRVGSKERSEEYYSLAMLYLERKQFTTAIGMLKTAFKENQRRHKILYQLALTSDSFYKDKKIAYNLYDDYFMRFEGKDKDITAFVKKRLKEIKKELFLKGEINKIK